MSLNRNEQMTYDYLHAQVDEKRHWQDVVRREFARAEGDVHAAAAVLERELWSYFAERAEVVEPFRGEARRGGLARTSMRNLAELLLRLWAPLPAKSATTVRP
jgi:hypothetical protein